MQALLLLFQLLSGREAVSDRFYRALYDVLLADGPFAATKAPMFMSLLYKVCSPATTELSMPPCCCVCMHTLLPLYIVCTGVHCEFTSL